MDNKDDNKKDNVISLDTVCDAMEHGCLVNPTIAHYITGIFDTEPKLDKHGHTVRTNQDDLDFIGKIRSDNKLW